MDELTEELLREQAQVSDQKILDRFRTLFGREMTASERKNFLLLQEDTVSAGCHGVGAVEYGFVPTDHCAKRMVKTTHNDGRSKNERAPTA